MIMKYVKIIHRWQLQSLDTSMLFLAVLLTMIRVGSAQGTKNNSKVVVCNGLIYNDTYYDKTILVRGSGKSLFLHNSSGELFFSRSVYNETFAESRIIGCHIIKRNCREIRGITGGFTIGYDRTNDKIYFGGIDGIYIYNNFTDSADFFAEEGNSVWGIFIRSNFYYIEYPSQHLYLKKGNIFVPSNIKAEVLTFYADKERIYYSNRSGLYSLTKHPPAEIVVLSTHNIVRQITEDGFGNIYFCASDGIYVGNKTSQTIKKLATVVGFGMTFLYELESGVPTAHLIYSDENNIYKLQPSKYSQLCYEAVLNSEGHLRTDQKSTALYLNLKLDFL